MRQRIAILSGIEPKTAPMTTRHPALRTRVLILICLMLGALTPRAQAVDFSLSGYGTLGYAVSDQADSYQRFIDDNGSLKHDSVLGAQLNAQFSPAWGATLQAKLAPATDSDRSVKAVLSWAFLSYRPTDDWLFRFGKLRIPFYLNSENADVGTTYVAARLPTEVYASATTVDFTGASFAKTWEFGDNELGLDGYWGKADSSFRFYARDYNNILTTNGKPGEFFVPLSTESRGLRLTLNEGGNTFLAGLHLADTTPRKQPTLGPETYVAAPATGCAPVNLPPALIGGDYYCPGANTYRIRTITSHVGASLDLGNNFRGIGEFVRRKNIGSMLAPDSKGYYLTLQKKIGAWTPYLTYARLYTKNRDLYRAVNGVNTAIPQVNAFDRALADTIVVYDQTSWALGSAYKLDSNSVLKAEWSVVDTGSASSFVDAPPGGESGKLRINVFSLSYNFTF
jgi:hypothetical protein